MFTSSHSRLIVPFTGALSSSTTSRLCSEMLVVSSRSPNVCRASPSASKNVLVPSGPAVVVVLWLASIPCRTNALPSVRSASSADIK